jgi:uncharacterized tellurite resistance protein B-like protein
MSLLEFLGVAGIGKQARERGDTATVRRIAAQLERLDPALAKFLASFAYVLARVAAADLEIKESETDEMERIVRTLALLSDGEAALVVQIAKTQAHVLGDTENYVVTREFRRISDRQQRAKLLQCVYAVAAADGTISSVESSVIQAIAEELGFTRAEANALRSEYRDKLSELREARGGRC